MGPTVSAQRTDKDKGSRARSESNTTNSPLDVVQIVSLKNLIWTDVPHEEGKRAHQHVIVITNTSSKLEGSLCANKFILMTRYGRSEEFHGQTKAGPAR